MIQLFDKEGNELRSFPTATSDVTRTYVTFINGGYLSKIYANIDAGEYFDDPDDPLPPEPEVLPSADAEELLQYLEGLEGGATHVN